MTGTLNSIQSFRYMKVTLKGPLYLVFPLLKMFFLLLSSEFLLILQIIMQSLLFSANTFSAFPKLSNLVIYSPNTPS